MDSVPSCLESCPGRSSFRDTSLVTKDCFALLLFIWCMIIVAVWFRLTVSCMISMRTHTSNTATLTYYYIQGGTYMCHHGMASHLLLGATKSHVQKTITNANRLRVTGLWAARYNTAEKPKLKRLFVTSSVVIPQ